ncbi:hypothetical protein RB653_001525 [Dictyostelium firmibasis]|uniref:Trehalase n=1 Tax=Dictyostelium firmibasis TaxID=79012 RepID=A0AAN7TYP5_9MYCE
MDFLIKKIQTILFIGICIISFFIVNLTTAETSEIKNVNLQLILGEAGGTGGCQHPIYCNGTLLKTIQLVQVFNDSKTFVDMPMRSSAEFINEQFNQLLLNTSNNGGPNKEELAAFLSENFYPAGYEVEPVTPVDWVPNPSFLDEITDPNLNDFARSIHGKWLELTRIFNTSGLCDGCYSSIPVNNPFVIAGSRFREFYYWDSYWIIQGLLVSDMTTTAKGMLKNFADMISEFGFIPNGGRIYYLNRSQPPLFTQMVNNYIDATGDMEFLQEILPILDQEYQWWMTHRTSELTNEISGETVILNLYNASNHSPRPESYYEDYTDALGFSSDQEKDYFYSSIASGAESGWDFSSRWMSPSDNTNLTTIQTIDVIPVDLNSILYLNEKILSQFHRSLGNNSMAIFYQSASDNRVNAMQQVFFNENTFQWNDYNLKTNTNNQNWYTSNILPLFADIQSSIDIDNQEIDLLFKSLANVLMGYTGGVPTSLISAQSLQWDGVNVWPPLQYWVIESIMTPNTTFSNLLGKNLIDRWITTNFCGWNSTLESQGGMMFEKYNANFIGVPGGGGEYVVQNGFGWTNGVDLYLLKKYGKSITLNNC